MNSRESIHQLRLGSPDSWYMMGTDLLVSGARLIGVATCKNEEGTFDWRTLGPGLMLRGFGVENLLKGLYLLSGGSLEGPPKSGDMPGPYHDLMGMAVTVQSLGLVGTRPGPGEQPMMEALKGLIQFAGRYPVPRKPEGLILNKDLERDSRIEWCLGYEKLFEGYIRRIGWPYLSRKKVATEGSTITLQEVHDQWVSTCVCTRWIETGGSVGVGMLAPWAVHLKTLAVEG